MIRQHDAYELLIAHLSRDEKLLLSSSLNSQRSRTITFSISIYFLFNYNFDGVNECDKLHTSVSENGVERRKSQMFPFDSHFTIQVSADNNCAMISFELLFSLCVLHSVSR